ncbi:hypothetical protein E3Q08_03963 [Wallemia mellicola]|uniref:Plasma membrane fusion protein PRM1 n=1 Tax=Wallemia mellicola TaxID=1708541 RepID=A0AB38MVI0_9BASI|nr:hypothetical protein E3Q21_03980 [Wallemia mellicola]TIB83894.1 hypothetical protein E3Q20_03933 [Wallemia mellicola]TIC00569.1 hypothetical protein E3Q16_03949 [Wallemia mellicola]TIC20012.1 hypothetical protein E3Q12_03976 [Wallemia mellicola]TIC31974.1 hypothetical protein E3Q09_03846 [Wallemia mellicola]
MELSAPPSYTRARNQQAWYQKEKTGAQDASKTTIRPYLGIKSRSAITLLAPFIIGVIFAIVTIASFRITIDGIAGSTIASANSICRHVQATAEDAFNMPLQAQRKLGQQVQDSITDIIAGLESVLLLLIKAIPIIVMFFIDFYRSLLLCFIQLIVQAALAAVTELFSLASSAIEDVAHTIGDAVSGAFNVANDAIDGINDLISWTGKSIDPINVPGLDALNSFQMPDSVQNTLNEINDKLPDLEDLRNYLNGIISEPFNNLYVDVQGKFDSYKTSANDTNALATSRQPQSLNFCSDLDLSVVTDLASTIKKIGHYQTKQFIEDCAIAKSHDERHLMELIASNSNPYVYKWTRRMPATRRDGIRWFALIMMHPYIVTLFCMGLIGFVSTGAQLVIIDKLQNKFIVRAQSSYNKVETQLEQALAASTSGILSNKTNNAIDIVETTINDDIFGWVDDGVVPINDTLTAFEDGLNNAIETAFNGTFIEDAIANYVQCVIGSKIDTLESGLTWIHDNAHVNLFRVPEDIFNISSSLSSAMTPLQKVLIGDSNTGEKVTIVVVSALIHRKKHDPEDEAQFVLLDGGVPPIFREEKTRSISSSILNVNPPTPERTTTIVPSPAYSSRISWVYDANNPDLAAVRYSTLGHLNNVIEGRKD